MKKYFFIKDLYGRSISFDYHLTMTVRDVMYEVSRKIGIPVLHQRIVFAGREITEWHYQGKTLINLGIRHNSCLSLVVRLPAGKIDL